MSLAARLSRLLFIVPYVAERDGVPLAELAATLHVTTAQIEADLDLLMMVGQPPLTPDHLIDIYVEDEVVYVALDQSLSRPPQLTHEEARALVLGIRLLGSSGAFGADLERVLAKIVEVLNPVDREMVRSFAARVGLAQEGAARPSLVDDLLAAVEEHYEVVLDYYSASSDREKQYRLRPLGLVTHAGVQYLVALDVDAEGHEKLFRLDRMGASRVTSERFAPPGDFDLEKFRTSRLYSGGSGDCTATLRFSPAVAPRAAELFSPEECTRTRDGALEVRVSTSSPAWLARWVLPFGRQAEVLAPAELRRHVGELCSQAARAYALPLKRKSGGK